MFYWIHSINIKVTRIKFVALIIHNFATEKRYVVFNIDGSKPPSVVSIGIQALENNI